MVLILILIYFEWLDTENQQYATGIRKILFLKSVLMIPNEFL